MVLTLLENKTSENEDVKFLENISFNDRSLVAYYDPSIKTYVIILFHVSEQPNEVSKKSPYSTWGYATRVSGGIYNAKEAAEVVGFFLKDLLDENYWWEFDK